MNPILSIIIPCYNSQNTLEETLISVLEQDYQDWEAIMVNDGSPDNLEEIAIKWTEKDARFKYFKKENGGLGSARNYGINRSKGDYILPLDSDNKISKKFAKKAVIIFQENSNVGVVYGDAIRFGEKNEFWKVGALDKHKMLEHNYIDACAIIRKKNFNVVGLYDENLPYQGHEDWDLWLRLINASVQFYYLEEITFHYRIQSKSMINSFDMKMIQPNTHYIEQKHYKLYASSFRELYKNLEKIKNAKNKVQYLRVDLKAKFFKIKESLINKNK